MDAVPTLLASFQELHRQGCERLKVHAYVYETGHWRCALGVVGRPMLDLHSTFRYSSGASWQFFAGSGTGERGEDLTYITPGSLAELFVKRYPQLMDQARHACKPYAIWYELLMEACGPDGNFVMSAPPDYDAKQAGYVRVYRRDAVPARFPLAPAF
jgi:hypothetical protein